MRGTVKHYVGKRVLVELDQVVAGRNALTWKPRQFRLVEGHQPSAE
jgi:hypothetical protein